MRNSINKEEIVAKYVTSLIEPLQNATKIGAWDGLDGAAQYLRHSRIIGLKHHGEDAYSLGLRKCFEVIVGITLEQPDQNTVLTSFTKENTGFVLNLSKQAPEIFITNEGKIAQLCKSVMAGSDKKKFEKNLTSNENKIRSRL